MIVRSTALPRGIVVAQLAALERELFGQGAWNSDMVRQELDAPARTYLLDVDRIPIEQAGTSQPEQVITGYGGFWHDGVDAELMTLGVARRFERRGIARALLNALIAAARHQGASRMLLEVRVDNDPALGLYRSAGFIVMGRRRRYYQPEDVDAFTMSLDIAGHGDPSPKEVML